MNNATADLNSATGVDQAQPPLASGGSELAPLGIPAYPKAPQVVLYDQYDNASVIGTLSATFTDFPPFNSDLADDFVVPTGQTWNVQSIDADGLYSGSWPCQQFQCVLLCRQCAVCLAPRFTVR